MKDNDWLLLFLLLYYNPDFVNQINKEYQQIQKNKNYQYNCPNIEWEEDMGAHIPFCKQDGNFCNLQCRRKNGNNSCI